MNRNSPVPLWAVLCVGVVLVGGVYVLGKPSIVVPQFSVASGQPMKAPKVIDQPSSSAASINLTSPSSSMLITDEYPMIENQARTIAGYAELRLFTADRQHSQNLYFFTAKKSLPESLLTIRFSTQTHDIDPTASINSDKDQSFAPVILSPIRLSLERAENISRDAVADLLAHHRDAKLVRSQLLNRKGAGARWEVIWAVGDTGPREVVSLDAVSGVVVGKQLLNP